MEDLSQEQLELLQKSPQLKDLDLDHLGVSLGEDASLGQALSEVCGISLSLATSKMKFYDKAFYGTFDFIYLVCEL